jgi:hypothetical protein
LVFIWLMLSLSCVAWLMSSLPPCFMHKTSRALWNLKYLSSLYNKYHLLKHKTRILPDFSYEKCGGNGGDHPSLFSIYALQPSRLIVRSGLDVPTFTTRRLHASPCESTQWRKVELWARNVREFYLNADLHVTFKIFYMP